MYLKCMENICINFCKVDANVILQQMWEHNMWYTLKDLLFQLNAKNRVTVFHILLTKQAITQ